MVTFAEYRSRQGAAQAPAAQIGQGLAAMLMAYLESRRDAEERTERREDRRLQQQYLQAQIKAMEASNRRGERQDAEQAYADQEALQDESVGNAKARLDRTVGELGAAMNPSEGMLQNPDVSQTARDIASYQIRGDTATMTDPKANKLALLELTAPMISELDAKLGAFRLALTLDRVQQAEGRGDLAAIEKEVDKEVRDYLVANLPLPEGNPLSEAIKQQIAVTARAKGVTSFKEMPSLALLGDDVKSENIDRIALTSPGAAARGVVTEKDRADAAQEILGLLPEGERRAQLRQGLIHLRDADPDRYEELTNQIATSGIEDFDSDLLETEGPVRSLASEMTWYADPANMQSQLQYEQNPTYSYSFGGVSGPDVLPKGSPRQRFDRDFRADSFLNFEQAPPPPSLEPGAGQGNPDDEMAQLRDFNQFLRDANRGGGAGQGDPRAEMAMLREFNQAQGQGPTQPGPVSMQEGFGAERSQQLAGMAAGAAAQGRAALQTDRQRAADNLEAALAAFVPELGNEAPPRQQRVDPTEQLRRMRQLDIADRPSERELTEPRQFDPGTFEGLLRTIAKDNPRYLLDVLERARRDARTDSPPVR